MPDASALRKTLICLSVWILPLITASIATGLGAMAPVSGNWCWIEASRPDLRYGLTHGWRMAIILITAGIYLFIWWYMHRHFRSLVNTISTSSHSHPGATWASRRQGFTKMKGSRRADGRGAEDSLELSTVSKSRISRIGDDWELSAPEAAHVGAAGGPDEEEGGARATRSTSASDPSTPDHDGAGYDKAHGIKFDIVPGCDDACFEPITPTGKSRFDDGLRNTDTMVSEFPTRTRTRDMEREIKRMLLLNAYPIMYVILWIPGLVNRVMEATGDRNDSRVLATLQASSQFVGLANSITYGFNSSLRKKFSRWWGRMRGKK